MRSGDGGSVGLLFFYYWYILQRFYLFIFSLSFPCHNLFIRWLFFSYEFYACYVNHFSCASLTVPPVAVGQDVLFNDDADMICIPERIKQSKVSSCLIFVILYDSLHSMVVNIFV